MKITHPYLRAGSIEYLERCASASGTPVSGTSGRDKHRQILGFSVARLLRIHSDSFFYQQYCQHFGAIFRARGQPDALECVQGHLPAILHSFTIGLNVQAEYAAITMHARCVIANVLNKICASFRLYMKSAIKISHSSVLLISLQPTITNTAFLKAHNVSKHRRTRDP